MFYFLKSCSVTDSTICANHPTAPPSVHTDTMITLQIQVRVSEASSRRPVRVLREIAHGRAGAADDLFTSTRKYHCSPASLNESAAESIFFSALSPLTPVAITSRTTGGGGHAGGRFMFTC